MRHLRNALIRIGLDPADADHYAGHSVRSGAATATADELPPHLISLAAGVKALMDPHVPPRKHRRSEARSLGPRPRRPREG